MLTLGTVPSEGTQYWEVLTGAFTAWDEWQIFKSLRSTWAA